MQLIRRFMALPALLALLGCSHRSNAEHVVLYLNWFPEVEHAGYYDALIHGYYLEAGLDVEIRPGGAGSQPCRQISPSRAEFGVDNADAILMNRSIGAPVVALMAPLQDSPVCVMVHASSGVRDIRELKGKTLAITPGAPYSEYLSRHGLLEGVRVVNYSGNIGQFLQDQAVAQQGYVFSEPVRAAAGGANPVSLPISKLGFNPYASVLVAGEAFVKSRPDLVARMVKASVRGWRHFVDDPSEVNRKLAELNPEVPGALVPECAIRTRPLVVAGLGGPDEIGMMTPKRWQALIAQLAEIGLVKPAAVNVNQVADFRFIREAGPGGQAGATIPPVPVQAGGSPPGGAARP